MSTNPPPTAPPREDLWEDIIKAYAALQRPCTCRPDNRIHMTEDAWTDLESVFPPPPHRDPNRGPSLLGTPVIIDDDVPPRTLEFRGPGGEVQRVTWGTPL